MKERGALVAESELPDLPIFREIFGLETWIPQKLSLLESSRPDVYRHSLRVAFIAAEISPQAFLPGKHKLKLTESALLHDIGKIDVPIGILEKEGELSAGEKEQMEKHVLLGYEKVKIHNPLIAQIMVGHHEYQPNPYPRKITRKEVLPEIATVQFLLALCDTTDALLSNRSYKPAWAPEGAQDYLVGQFKDWSLVRFAIKTRLRIRSNL